MKLLMCVNFSTGFAKRSDLNRHNEKYHTTYSTYISLSETINSVIKLPLRAKVQSNILADDTYINYAADPFQSRLDEGQRPGMVPHNPSEEAQWSQRSLEPQTNYSDKPTLEPPEQGRQGNQTREWRI
jgi:hypothetical protein